MVMHQLLFKLSWWFILLSVAGIVLVSAKTRSSSPDVQTGIQDDHTYYDRLCQTIASNH